MTDPLMMSTCCPPDSGEVVPVIRCAGRWFNEIRPETAMAARILSVGASCMPMVPSLLCAYRHCLP
jgi:hypothetical protein